MQSCRLCILKLPTSYIKVGNFASSFQYFRYYYFSTFDIITSALSILSFPNKENRCSEQRKFCSKRNEKIIEGRWCSYSRGNIEGWNSAWFAKQEKGRNLMAFTLPLFNYLLCYLTLALCQCPKAKVYLFIPFMVNEMRLRFTSTSVTFTITCWCSFSTSLGSFTNLSAIWLT